MADAPSATRAARDDDQHQFGGIAVNVISGDPDVYGRAYVDAYGSGVVYGDPS